MLFPRRIDLNFVIKITDFGLSEDMYARNYFRQSSSGEVVKLPVKWMAPESLSDGHFSEKSDVVRKFEKSILKILCTIQILERLGYYIESYRERKHMVIVMSSLYLFSQWSYGITLWEVFSGGKTPYPGVDPPSLVRLLDRGERMSKPDNVACNQEMYVDCVTILYTMIYVCELSGM